MEKDEDSYFSNAHTLKARSVHDLLDNIPFIQNLRLSNAT